jgi:hypothetical protein
MGIPFVSIQPPAPGTALAVTPHSEYDFHHCRPCGRRRLPEDHSMSWARTFALVIVPAAAALLSSPVDAQNYVHRQYYSGWRKHNVHAYHYRFYYYKPTPTYSGYKHHYVIYFPTRPRHCYFYNPYKRGYWGRCPIDHGGQPMYSMLAEADRKQNVADIPEAAFPKPGPVPSIPEASDNLPLDLPPDDVPTAETPQ